eukprot:COSAG01_NODE_817_length_13376_cov_2.970101_7_plen_86_part_00
MDGCRGQILDATLKLARARVKLLNEAFVEMDDGDGALGKDEVSVRRGVSLIAIYYIEYIIEYIIIESIIDCHESVQPPRGRHVAT